MRVGQGYDVHRFGEGDHILLGGVRIEHHQGLVAHSDGDVLIHALCDALLGAAAIGDIGQHFPDTDEQYAGVDSRGLLTQVLQILTENAYQIINIDTTIVAQEPKLSPFINEMRENLASDLNISVSQVSIKATTTEQLGFEGRGEGIGVHAIVLIESKH